MFGVQNHKIKAFPANANIYSFCKIKPKYKLGKTRKFKGHNRHTQHKSQ